MVHEDQLSSKIMSVSQISENLLSFLSASVRHDSYWKDYFDELASSRSNMNNIPRVHLAILVEPYLDFILQGKKTVESRFSCNRIAPYQKVDSGDIILLKRSGGPLLGLCEVSDVWFYRLDPRSWSDIKREFTEMLCAQDPSFWSERASASFATLMRVKHPVSISPIRLTKRDRRAWIILHNGSTSQERLEIDEEN